MFLNKGFKQLQNKGLRPPLASTLRATSATPQPQFQQRPYFSVFEKIKDRFRTPMKHIAGFVEPDGYAASSQMPEGYRLHGNSAASYSASLTQNALELNQWHEMESTVHS